MSKKRKVKNKKQYMVYVALCMGMLIVPFAGMTFWATNETTENKEMVSWPSFKTENGRWNWHYLSDMGNYFEEHFAFRQQFVTANACVRSKVLRSSATDQVVLGNNDWLYYSGTLDDYQGKSMLSVREQYAVVHNIKLMQDYVESQGSQFILTIAPNKNSLYSENMPYYYRKGNESNLDAVTKQMENIGINYVDLYEGFRSKEDEVMYFQRDSHWNNKGAMLAYNLLMDEMGREHESYLNVPYESQEVHIGDLDEMLYPLAVRPEEDYILDKEWKFSYVNDVTDNMDDWIETIQPEKTETLLMYRDSFGESLLPFMAEEVGKGYFSRLVPYNLTQTEEYHPNYVVIEKVERNLAAFATQIPIMEPLEVAYLSGPEAETDTTVEVEKTGSYLKIQGTVDENYIKEETDIFVAVRENQSMETKMYPAFYTLTEEGDGNGYQIYLKGSSVPGEDLHVNIIVQNAGQNRIVASQNITWDKGE